jgi:polyvinyl alcohol dehydrogenase (cytochrome)
MMRTRALFGAIATAVAIVVAGSAPAAADWPMFGHDLSNSRSAGGAGPSPSAARALQQAWVFNSSNGDFTGTPVVSGGTLVAGTNLGSIYALDPATGKLRWSRDVHQQINGSAAIDPHAPGGPTVFVPVARIGGPHLLALSLATGRVRWDRVLSSQAGADVYGSPVYWRRTIYIGTSGPGNDQSNARGTVVALDEASGRLRWRTYTVPAGHDGGAVWTTPSIDTRTGRLYVGTGNAYHSPAAATTDSMLVMNASNGRMLGHFQSTPGDVWELDDPTGGPDYDFGASPNLITSPGGRRLVGEGQKSGTYWALDRATMRPVWRRSVGPGSQADGGIGSTAYDGLRIYGSDSVDGQVFALGRGGSLRWSSLDTGTLHIPPVAVGNGVLYSADSAGILTARDATTGAILTKAPLGGPTYGGISVVGHAVYVAVGVGPPSPILPLPADQTQQSDGSGSIVAFGDTRRTNARPVTFQGSCSGSRGSVRFNPPLTNTPRSLDQTVRVAGTCSGTLKDSRGRTHQLSGAPVSYAATEHADSASCAGGTDSGAGTLTFPYGQLRFTISEVRGVAGVLATLKGASSGSATAVAAAGGDPAAVLRQCAGGGLRQADIGNFESTTTPSISG